jgi:CDP-diacylglycerol--glycerol-3-phosphate 3-phosphatidyltransferase
VGLVLAGGYLFAGGLLIVVAGLFDWLDGALARLTNRITPFGGFLDSALDRYSEGLIYGGLLWVYVQQASKTQTGTTEVMLIFAVIVGSMMISYVRARVSS